MSDDRVRRPASWRSRERSISFRHPLLAVESHQLESNDGRRRSALVLDVPDWVNVVALTDDSAPRVLLVRQWRFGIAAPTLEIPGGMVDGEERSLEAARRELLEETGFRARSWHDLGWVEPNPAIQNNRCSTWLATDLERVGPPLGDGDEEIELVTLALAEIPERIRRGEIRHSLVIAAFHLLSLHR